MIRSDVLIQIDPVVADTCTETCLTHEWKHASLPAPTSPSRLYQSIFRLGFLLRLHRSIRAGPTCGEAIHPLFSCILLLLRHLRLSPSASLSVFCQHLQGRSRPRRVSSFSSSLSLCGFGIFIRVPFFFVPLPPPTLSPLHLRRRGPFVSPSVLSPSVFFLSDIPRSISV